MTDKNASIAMQVPPSLIDADPSTNLTRARKPIDPDDKRTRNLAASIKQHGLLCPVLLTIKGDRYVLLDGFRRLCAWGLLYAKDPPPIPATIAAAEDAKDSVAKAVTANFERLDSTPLEKTYAIRALLKLYPGMPPAVLARRIGLSQPTVSRYAAVATGLSEAAQKKIASLDEREHTGLTLGQLTKLASLSAPEQVAKFADVVAGKPVEAPKKEQGKGQKGQGKGGGRPRREGPELLPSRLWAEEIAQAIEDDSTLDVDTLCIVCECALVDRPKGGGATLAIEKASGGLPRANEWRKAFGIKVTGKEES